MKEVYDVLIAGSGVAGAYCALQFPPEVSVLVLSKYERTVCSSELAQGGVAAVLDFEDDSYELHANDTMIAGHFANDAESVDVLVHEGPDDVRRLMDMGVVFDRAPDGTLDKTLEGGHSRRRIVHHEDTTGAELVRVLQKEMLSRPNIDFSENTDLADLHGVRSGFRADLLVGGEPKSVFCSYCVLATGGIGRIYRHTTNPRSGTGDGIRIAHSLGAKIKDLSYVQFHPTAFDSPDGEQFLISESVRGEGAYLLNCHEERFMHRYDDRLELAPRDIVSKAIILESRRTGSNRFWLDIRYKDADYLLARFPGISEGCKKYGVDITKDLIPVFPCQHYLMGGIQVDLDSKTTVNRLYACGECSNTGVHGKNRLASNSLLEALVFSRHAANDIMRCMNSGFPSVSVHPGTFDVSGAPMPKNIRNEITEIMQSSYFVIPDESGIRTGHTRIDNIIRRLTDSKYAVTREYCETLSMATCADIILGEVDRI
ncbi:MAG: FAD-binding protein [Clostridiales bacterium]|nr:FAD-binding protein [Clostridiales bacterium]